MRLLRLSSHSDGNGYSVDLDWGQLTQLLTTHKITPCSPCPGKACLYKNGPAWVPATFGSKTNLKGNLRHKLNVLTLTAGVLDFDHLTPEALEKLVQLLEPFKCIIHTSHSHKPEDVCVRVVLALSREVKFSEWSRFYPKMVEIFGSQSDPACHNGDRIYYLPSCSSNSEHWAFASEGEEVIDVDLLLSEEAPAIAPSQPLDLSELRSTIKSEIRALNRKGQTDKALLLKRVIDSEPLADPGSRDTTINKVASQLAWTLPSNVSPEVCVQLLYFSISNMPDPEGEGLQHWLDKAKDSFVRAQERRLEQEEANRLAKEAIIKAMSKTPEDNWQEGLAYLRDGTIAGIGPNLNLIFTEAEQFQDAFRFNEVTKEIDTHNGIFKDEPKQTLHIAVSNYLFKEFAIRTEPQTVREQIAHISRKNSYDPLKEWLMSLTWDGVKRLQTFFVTYCNSPILFDDETSALDYYSKIGPKWFIGAVARALDPGQLVKSILVLEGKQNAKKSALIRALGGRYFSDAQINIRDKDSTLLMASKWIIELAEMSFMRGANSNEVKNFISRTEDHIRPPYGAVLEAFPRRAITVGTINDNYYLEDSTGNVRYWPVKVGLIDVDKVLEDRDQLWAEAVQLYLNGSQWWLEAEDVEKVELQTSERIPDDPLLEIFLRWYLNFEPDKRPAELSTLEVALTCLGQNKDKIDKHTEQRIGLTLAKLKFTKKRTNKRFRYIAPKELLEAARVPITGGLL